MDGRWRFAPLVGLLFFVGLILARALFQRWRYAAWGVLLFRGGRPGQAVRDALLVLLVQALRVRYRVA